MTSGRRGQGRFMGVFPTACRCLAADTGAYFAGFVADTSAGTDPGVVAGSGKKGIRRGCVAAVDPDGAS